MLRDRCIDDFAQPGFRWKRQRAFGRKNSTTRERVEDFPWRSVGGAETAREHVLRDLRGRETRRARDKLHLFSGNTFERHALECAVGRGRDTLDFRATRTDPRYCKVDRSGVRRAKNDVALVNDTASSIEYTDNQINRMSFLALV